MDIVDEGDRHFLQCVAVGTVHMLLKNIPTQVPINNTNKTHHALHRPIDMKVKGD